MPKKNSTKKTTARTTGPRSDYGKLRKTEDQYGRTIYEGTFKLVPQSNFTSTDRYVTFSFPHEIDANDNVEIKFEIIKPDCRAPTFTANNISVNVSGNQFYPCRIATKGWDLDNKYKYQCKIEASIHKR